MIHLDGVLQGGVSVAGGLQALHQAGVEVPAAVHGLLDHGELLFEHLVDHKHSWVVCADVWWK